MNDGASGYGEKLQKDFNAKEAYLNKIIPKLQSHIIKTNTLTYSAYNLNATNIIFNDVEEYGLNNTYSVRVVDVNGNSITTGHVSFFMNGNLAYICKVNENGQAAFKLNEIVKRSGQYTITCQYSDILLSDNVKIGNITSNDIFKIKTIFEGTKVYNPDDLYKIKFLSNVGKELKDSEVIFSINNYIVGIGTINSEGIASCKIGNDILEILNSPNCFIKSEIYDENLNDYYVVNEFITIGTRSIPVMSKGSLLPKWRDTFYEVCDDGYHAYIDKNNYQLIEYDGTSFIVHVENITNNNQLKNLFKSLSSEKLQWDIVIVNLASKTYKIDFNTYSDREWDYALKFPYGQLIINGNNAIIEGKDDLNFMSVGAGANVIMDSLTLTKFNHCFYNYGMLYCLHMKFINNCAYKVDVLCEGSGAVIHNFNTAEFAFCNFNNNDARYASITLHHMAGGILCAEPFSTTYLYNNHYEGDVLYEDSIFAYNYCSIVITPGLYDEDSLYKYLIEKSFIPPFASITMINSLETITYDNQINRYNPLVFNCSTNKELKDALTYINKKGVYGSEVIINLVNKTYSYDLSEVKTFDRDLTKGYRGSFLDSYDDFRDMEHKVYIKYQQHYFLNVGFIPITINGNGAHIKISDNEISNDNHFAFIGHNGKLTLNNLSLSTFNTAFINAHGNLICKNCDFSGNKIEYTVYDGDDGGVLRSFKGSSVFINCTMKNNRAEDGSDFAYVVDGSYLELDNCTISQHYNVYATLKDSKIKCPKDLYNNHISAKTTKFIDNTQVVDFVHYVLNNTQDFDNITSSNIISRITVIEFNFDCSVDLNKFISRPGIIYIKSNGHEVNVQSILNIPKEAVVCLEGFTFNNKFITNNGELTLTNCNLWNSNSKTMFTNYGQCSISNCSISNNKCENIFDNKGSLSILNSQIENNKASEYGIIYNNGGSVFFANDTFISNSGADIYNFRTPNCAIMNCDKYSIIFKEPLSAVKLDGIKTGLMAGTMLITGGIGYGIGAALGPCVVGLILSLTLGTAIGGGIGLAYGAIESSTLHDYSHLWSNVGSFAMIGFSASFFGYTLGTLKYNAKQNINVKNNLIENDNPVSEQSTHHSSTESQKIEIDESLKKTGNEINKEISKRSSVKRFYEELVDELDKSDLDLNKINNKLKRLDFEFERRGLNELGKKTFEYLHTKYSKSWPLAVTTQNQILNRLQDLIYIYSDI